MTAACDASRRDGCSGVGSVARGEFPRIGAAGSASRALRVGSRGALRAVPVQSWRVGGAATTDCWHTISTRSLTTICTVGVARATSFTRRPSTGQFAHELPGLLEDADSVWRPGRGGATVEATLSYVAVFVVAAKLLTKLGASDLAMVAADRAATGAMCAESSAARGLAGYQIACAMLAASRPDDAEHLALGLAKELTAKARSDDPSIVSVAGALWLIAGVIAARKAERFESHDRLFQG